MTHLKKVIGIIVFLGLLGIAVYLFKKPTIKSDTSLLNPTVSQFLQDLAKQNAAPIYTLAPVDARKVLDTVQASSVNTMPAEVKDLVIPISSDKNIPVRIVRPEGRKEILPVVLYSHGGGWVLGNKDTHDLLIRRLANWAQVAIVFIEYTLAPEAQYPVQIDQIFEVLQYVAQHGKELNLDSNKIALAGDSVGGQMTALVALKAKEIGSPKILAQVLLYPVTDAEMNTTSYNQFADGYYWLSKKAMAWFWDMDVPNKADRKAASPLQYSLEQLRGLPPTLVITDENDVLRDEGEAFAHKLMQAGVDTTGIRILGTVHDFMILAPLKDSRPTISAIEIASDYLARMLHDQ